MDIFNSVIENELVNIVKKMANIFSGYNQIKVVFDYSESSNMAAGDCLDAFMTGNNISARKPEITSINRIADFNKPEVQLFYKLLGELLDKNRFVQKKHL